MITVVAKSKTGQIVTFEFVEIVSIDGQPYVRQASDMEFRNIVADLAGRVAALEAVIANSQESN